MDTTAGQPKERSTVGICVALAAVVLILFGPSVRYEFVNYDDDQYVYENQMVAKGLTLPGIVWAFSRSHSANWHPVTWISHMVDCELYGLHAGGHHLSNVLLHAANTVLIFLLLLRMTNARWRSALVAALFALHPLHVESVAWISERKDVLSTSFGLLTLLMYARYAQAGATGQRPGGRGFASRDYRRAILFFALGLMSKSMLVTLPFVMLLLDWWPLQRTPGPGLLREKAPFFALSTASCVVTFLVQSSSGAAPSLASISMVPRIENAFVAYARYLYKMFWPVNLAVPYPHPGHWPAGMVVLSVALVFGVGILAIGLGRKASFLAVGWFWYLGMLIPVIGLVQVGTQSMADRYSYLPLVGIFIILVWGAAAVISRIQFPKPVAATGAALILGACFVRSRDQSSLWQNSESLFRHAVKVTKRNSMAYYNLGYYYHAGGRWNEAIENYRNAIQIRPDYDDALNNLGTVLASEGQMDEAIVRIQEAIHCRPDKADAYYNLGNVFVMQRTLNDAVSAYTNALRLKPAYPEAHNNLANVLVMQGHTDEAVRHYQEVLRLAPDHQGAKRQLRALGFQSRP